MIGVHQEKYTVSTSSGSASQTIIAGGNICYDIFVKAATSSTTFDVSLTDIYGNVVYTRNDITGELSEQLQKLTYGNWTLNISGASADESFKILLLFRES